MKLLFLLSITILLKTPALACLNFYFSTDSEGHVHVADWPILDKPFDLNIDYDKYIKQLQKITKKIEKTPENFKLQADYATALLFVHQYERAAAILSNLAQKHPNEYNIATNLGTAYELLGKDELALEWIQKGLVLNPKSHEGSEWIHVRILEAKLKARKEPKYLETHSIIGLSSEHKLSKKELSSYRVALEYQIRTRLGFTPLPNDLMANLCADLAALYAITWSTHYGILLYKIALKYTANPKLEQLYKTRLSKLETYAQSSEFKQKYEKAIAENKVSKPTKGGILRVTRRRLKKYFKPKNSEVPKDLASKVNLGLLDHYQMLASSPSLEKTELASAVQKAKIFAMQHLPKEELKQYAKATEDEQNEYSLSSDTVVAVAYDSLEKLENAIKEDTLNNNNEGLNIDKNSVEKHSKSSLYPYLLIIGVIGLCIVSFILVQSRKKQQ